MSKDHQNPVGDGAAAPAPAPKPTLNPRPAGKKVTTGGLGQTIGNMKDDLQWHGGEPRAARPKPEEGDTPKTKGGGLLDAVGASVGKVVGEVAGVVKEGAEHLEDFVKNTATSLPPLKKSVFEWPALHKAEPFPKGGRLPTDLTEVLANHNNALGASPSKAEKPCRKLLKISLFFDGTNNHEEADAAVVDNPVKNNEDKAAMAGATPHLHKEEIKPYQYPRTTNVARLFHACMGVGGGANAGVGVHDQELAEKGWFRYYMQGVGTRFKEVGDANPSMTGEAFARFGQARINWGLTRICDALAQSGCFNKTERLSNDEAAEMVSKMTTPETRYETIKGFLKDLKPQEGKPMAEGIQLYVVGFSRGAAQARTFVNWLLDYCQAEAAASKGQPAETEPETAAAQAAAQPLPQSAGEAKQQGQNQALSQELLAAEDGNKAAAKQTPKPTDAEDKPAAEAEPEPLLFHGIPIWIEMVGLFDTVASVGLSPAVPFTAGHLDWAHNTMPLDRAAAAGLVKNCYHFVAAHEQRKSFSVDSICVSGGYPKGNFQEILYPGVHSDVGGGYPPGEQYRARLGMGHVLSQIALHDMYAKAWAHGMPLQVNAQNSVLAKALEKKPKVQLAIYQKMSEETAQEYGVEPELVERYNHWQSTQTATKLPDALKEQVHHVTAWRILRWVKGDYASYLGLSKADAKEKTAVKKARAKIIAAARKAANQGIADEKTLYTYGLPQEEYDQTMTAAAFPSTDSGDQSAFLNKIMNKNYVPGNDGHDLVRAAQEFQADYYHEFSLETLFSAGAMLNLLMSGSIYMMNKDDEAAEFDDIHTEGSALYFGSGTATPAPKPPEKRPLNSKDDWATAAQEADKLSLLAGVTKDILVAKANQAVGKKLGVKEGFELFKSRLENIDIAAMDAQRHKIETQPSGYDQDQPLLTSLYDDQLHDSRAWFMHESALMSREPWTTYFRHRLVFSGSHSNKPLSALMTMDQIVGVGGLVRSAYMAVRYNNPAYLLLGMSNPRAFIGEDMQSYMALLAGGYDRILVDPKTGKVIPTKKNAEALWAFTQDLSTLNDQLSKELANDKKWDEAPEKMLLADATANLDQTLQDLTEVIILLQKQLAGGAEAMTPEEQAAAEALLDKVEASKADVAAARTAAQTLSPQAGVLAAATVPDLANAAPAALGLADVATGPGADALALPALVALPPLAEPDAQALAAQLSAQMATFRADMLAQTAHSTGLLQAGVAADYGGELTQLVAETNTEVVQQALAALNLPYAADADLLQQLRSASQGEVRALLQQLEGGQLPQAWRGFQPEQLQQLREALQALA